MKDNQTKYPQLRFKGFTDPWEQRKLGEVYNFQYGQFNNNPDNGGQYPIYGANGIIGGYDEYNSENAIVIGHMGAYAGHVLWAEGKHFVTYNGTMGIADKSILNSNFGYYLVVSVNVPKLTAGSGQPFVSYSDLNGIKILIPTIEEQQKIGSFFKQLDNLITLHQRKLAKLKELKQGYLQNLFPKNGSKFPQLRFAGFADAWEQRKLGDLVRYQNGVGHEGNQLDEGKYELVNLNSISIDGGLKSSGKFINTVTRTLKKNDLVMVLSDVGHGDLLGRVAIIPENNRYVLNQRVALLSTNDQTDIKFLFSYINAHQRYFKREGAGSSQLNISRGSVEKFEVLLPTIDEQKQIGRYCSNIDNLITLHQRKLEKLQELKKGYLQKMFC
ncbi:restriction endonuclease subunit S [Lactiplantibacillus plantarum]|uniref:restriction endonuclease subunit S n=1 Tax=Lactiplantibacillus plantarum TaxID=1590 RepID=UPI001D068B1C|nr:restriction endonuclease subunit S [Lactiplantibacillus plantarum]MCB7467662.1 restriction endonuclease subunit S [Lactiplantibacillus plantarum]MCB7470532.1 restriction endonuclease subunit S [Lactiplantibacillus plantarum]MCB7473648.1 restriction endonuclease subunit S [Lactiplantibacillus plantarum]MCB7476623.1 restriction endonuclease subunit S [Lactiplantibacillus plantarum]MCB7479569.1 restriction endonuclease subunit S [Lactiplantibacillus plantarum]